MQSSGPGALPFFTHVLKYLPPAVDLLLDFQKLLVRKIRQLRAVVVGLHVFRDIYEIGHKFLLNR